MQYQRPTIFSRNLACFLAFLMVGVLGILLPSQSYAENATPLLVPKLGLSSNAENYPAWVTDVTPVMVNDSALSAASFSLPLGDDNVVAYQKSPLSRSSQSSVGSDKTTGPLLKDGEVIGKYVLTRTVSESNQVGYYGVFRTNDDLTVHTLQGDGNGGYVLHRLDGEEYPGCQATHEVSEEPAHHDHSPMAAVLTNDSGDVVVDVYVVYSIEAATAVGSAADMQALIETAVSETNQAYANSGVNMVLRLVGTKALNENENTESFASNLTRLRVDADGYYDSVHTERDDLGADLVVMMVNNNGACGIGVFPSNLDGPTGFSVVNHTCATGYYSFAHEIGHNMQLSHNVENSGSTPHADGYGFHFGSWRSVMAYSPGIRVDQFSNPAIQYQEINTGADGSANNARILNLNVEAIGNYRDAVSTVPVPGGGEPGGGETGGGETGGGGSGGTTPPSEAAYAVSLTASNLGRLNQITVQITADGSPSAAANVTLTETKNKKKKRTRARRSRSRTIYSGVTDANGYITVQIKAPKNATYTAEATDYDVSESTTVKKRRSRRGGRRRS